jgi:hypothetical protein
MLKKTVVKIESMDVENLLINKSIVSIMRNCSDNRKTNLGARIKPEFQALPSNKRMFNLRSSPYYENINP